MVKAARLMHVLFICLIVILWTAIVEDIVFGTYGFLTLIEPVFQDFMNLLHLILLISSIFSLNNCHTIRLLFKLALVFF